MQAQMALDRHSAERIFELRTIERAEEWLRAYHTCYFHGRVPRIRDGVYICQYCCEAAKRDDRI